MIKSHELFLLVIRLICDCARSGDMSDWHFQSRLISTPPVGRIFVKLRGLGQRGMALSGVKWSAVGLSLKWLVVCLVRPDLAFRSLSRRQLELDLVSCTKPIASTPWKLEKGGAGNE